MCRNAYVLLGLISLWIYGYRYAFKNWSLARSWIKNFVCGPWSKKLPTTALELFPLRAL